MTTLTRRAALAALAGSNCLLVEAQGEASLGSASSLLEIEGRLLRQYQRVGPKRSASELMALQQRDGEWPDINYADQSVANWLPIEHLRRLKSMCLSLSVTDRHNASAANVLGRISTGLQFWLTRSPSSGNWWHNTIGVPSELGPILILCGRQLNPELRDRAASLLIDSTQVPPSQATAQNLVWYTRNQLVRGVVRRDPKDVALATRLASSQIAMTDQEGIQADFSFHQHGPQLYSGGYGLNFLIDITEMAGLLIGTPWAFKAEQIELLAEYALKGICPLVWRGWFDWAAQGREFTRASRHSKIELLSRTLKQLREICDKHRQRLAAAILELDGREEPSAGVVRYWRSDVLVSRVSSLYCSIKSCSERTTGTESGNGENLQGFWIPFGMTCLLRHGDEFNDLQFVWDWSRLPGVTSTDEVPAFSGYQQHQSAFVGSAVSGAAGVAAMVLNKYGVRAKKSWFVLGSTMVALGTGIQSDSPRPISTTVNQAKLRGSVVVSDGSGNTSFARAMPQAVLADQVWHDGLTYRALDGHMQVQVRQLGSDVPINREMGRTDLRLPVLSLQIVHGERPTNATYAYGVSAFETDAAPSSFPLDLVRVVRNDRSAQCVEFLGTARAVLAVMHEPATVQLENSLTVSVSTPCVLAAALTPSGWTVAVSDPTTRLKGATLTVLRKDARGHNSRQVHRIDFPGGGQQAELTLRRS